MQGENKGTPPLMDIATSSFVFSGLDKSAPLDLEQQLLKLLNLTNPRSMFSPHHPPPLVSPESPRGDLSFAFPGYQSRQQSMNSPWPLPHDHPPPWAGHPPEPGPPPWFNDSPDFHARTNSWGTPSPYRRPPANTWGEPPTVPPWSETNSPMRHAESTFDQPIRSGFFGSNNHRFSPNHSPWNAMIRSVSDHEEKPHSATPPWATPHQQPWDKLSRSRSTGSSPRSRTPFQSPRAALPPHLLPDTWNETNLARRPKDWRSNYNPRASFLSSLTALPSALKAQSDVQEFTDPTKRRLSPLLEYRLSKTPLSHDLRLDPFDPANPIQHSQTAPTSGYRHPFNEIDMAQFATTPPANILRLFHPQLPWYIDVVQVHPNGITVMDVVAQVYDALTQQILPRHYWNDVLTPVDRAEIGKAYGKRVSLFGGGAENGILWVDFLSNDIIFEGLAKTKGGLWEIKTKRVPG